MAKKKVVSKTVKVQKKVTKKKVAVKAPQRLENFDLVKYFKTGEKEHMDDWAFVEGNVMSVITNHPKTGDYTAAGIKVNGYIIINGDDVGDNVGDFSDVQEKLQDYDENEITTSFKCLLNAGINLHKIKVLETTQDLDVQCERGDKGFADFESTVPQGATYKEYPSFDYDLEPEDDGYDLEEAEQIVSKRYHRAGGMLIREGKYSYICGMDEDSYFITRLPKHASTIDAAYKSLKPKAVITWEKKNDTVAKRQGEWFFLPTELTNVKGMRRKGLPLWKDGGNKHMPDSYAVQDGKHYVKGGVTHIDHQTTQLGNVIHEAVMNTATGSWSEQGVD
jgi:hypothetical protein